MKLERMISMINMLLSNEVVSASALAEKYQVSQRTIYRDIDTICAAGIPVVSYQGIKGGYGIMDTYRMDRSLLGSYDAATLVNIIHSLSGLFEDNQAMETANKLQSITRENETAIVNINLAGRARHTEYLRVIRKAIHEQEVIKFNYMNGDNEISTRELEPECILYKYKDWYIKGYCRSRKQNREFKLSRMWDLTVCAVKFQRKSPQDPAANGIDRELVNNNLMEVVMHVASNARARALDYFPEAEKLIQSDGSLVLRILFEAGGIRQRLLPYILSFGEGVTVEQPSELKAEIIQTIDKMAQNYKTKNKPE